MADLVRCKACALVARRDEGAAPLWDNIQRTQFWDVVHCNETALLGWMVVVARRHMEAVDELTPDEAVDLGLLLQKVSAALKEVTRCAKTYVLQFAEAEGFHHVHFHVIPRMPDLPEEYRSVKIFRLLGASEAERASEEAMNKFAEEIRRILESK